MADISEENLDNIYETIKDLKAKKRGQHMDNIIESTEKNYGWTEETTRVVINKMEGMNLLKTILYNNKLVYRIIEASICLDDDRLSETSKDTEIEINEVTSDSVDIKTMINELEDLREFKLFACKRLSNLQEQIDAMNFKFQSNNKNLARDIPDEHYREMLDGKEAMIKVLSEDIYFLREENTKLISMICDKHCSMTEKTSQKIANELESNSYGGTTKQKLIIEKRLDSKCVNSSRNNLPSMKSNKTLINSQSSTPINKNTEVTNTTRNRNKSSNQISNTTNNQISNTTNNQKAERKMIVVLGDSIVKNLTDKGLSKSHDVKVKANPGCNTEDIIDFINPIIRRKPDLIIIHSGTNDLTNEINTMNKVKKIVKIFKDLPSKNSIKLGFSGIIHRKDRDVKKEI